MIQLNVHSEHCIPPETIVRSTKLCLFIMEICIVQSVLDPIQPMKEICVRKLRSILQSMLVEVWFAVYLTLSSTAQCQAGHVSEREGNEE